LPRDQFGNRVDHRPVRSGVRLSQHHLSALRGTDDLVNQVVAKYGLEKAQAQRDVDALVKGRDI
jgi:hypothetical protein